MARASTKMALEIVKGDEGYKAVMKFANGEVREFEFNSAHALAERFMVHGVEQKLRDRIAASENVEEAVTDIDGLLEALNGGEWTTRGSGEPRDTSGLLVRALAQITGKTNEEVKAIVAGLDKKQQAALRADPDIKAVIDSLKPEPKAPKGVDLGALKATLGL